MFIAFVLIIFLLLWGVRPHCLYSLAPSLLLLRTSHSGRLVRKLFTHVRCSIRYFARGADRGCLSFPSGHKSGRTEKFRDIASSTN
jgi:hypothetical protein